MPAITSRGAATAVMPLLAAALLAACSGSITIGSRDDTVDPVQTAEAVNRRLKEIPDASVDRVTCPKGVKVKEGVTFQCTAEFEGAQLPVTVTLGHVDADKGSYEFGFKLAKALINTDRIVRQLEESLPPKAIDAGVDCGTPRIRVVEVGGAFDCTMTRGGERLVVHAVVDDVDGAVHFDPPAQHLVVASGRIGAKLTVYGDFRDPQLEVTVTRVKFSRGDEFERPQRGYFLGAYVTGHALADDQYVYNLYAKVGGHLYEPAITGATGFDPMLEPTTLNKGERTSGWQVFDVPSRHGQVVLRDLDEQTIGVWKY